MQNQGLFVPSKVDPDNWAEEEEDVRLICGQRCIWRRSWFGGTSYAVERGRHFICNFFWFMGIYLFFSMWKK